MQPSTGRIPRISNPTRRQIAFIAVLALFSISAATPPESTSNGMVIGAFSAAILLAIVGITFARLVLPLRHDEDSGLDSALITLAALAAVKIALIPFFPGFGNDIGSYESWALQIATQGPAKTYQEGYFLDYPPGYLYGLWVAGLLAKLINASGETLRVIAESPAIVADFFLAIAMFAYVRKSSRVAVAFAATLMIALNPAFLFDTVVWGQSDSVLSFTMLLSVIALLDGQYDLCWGLAAISVLIKPQGLMLVPVLGWWTMLETDIWRWFRCGIVAILVFIVGIVPFQIGHHWNWILELYTSTAAYYHETSVNAFNLMALIGGLRQGDDGLIGGVSYFALGMSMLVPLYGFIAWILWRKRSRTTLMYAAFLAVFGFFMVAPRMHERYLYPALVFAIPIALESTEMLVLFCVLSLTCLFNLAYVLHILQINVFLDARDTMAMVASGINTVLFGLAIFYGITRLEGASELIKFDFGEFAKALFPDKPPAPVEETTTPALVWNRTDTIAIAALVVIGGISRFWHLGHPKEIVFDEIHFVANQARHYLHGESFLDPHPPLDKLVITAGIWLFGDNSWSWRVGNAVLGTILIGVTYLLGRRMVHSRLAAVFASAIIVLDGMFLVDSRTGVIDIAYLTFAAISYWLFFVFIETPDAPGRRRVLPWLGVALGLCVGSKLYIPAITFLLVVGFMVWVLMHEPGRRRDRRAIGSVLLVGGVASIAYIAVFLPHFFLGWWRGIEDLFHYYKEIVWYEGSVASATHPYSSPWWSWPLMLRPIAYWQDFPKTGKVSTIWGGGNPLLWWGGLTAVTITAVRAFERPNLRRSFLVIGYLGYIVIWIWIGRTLFLYHYLASIYLAYIALAWILEQCWVGEAEPWEHLALLLTMAPVFVLGIGAVWGFVIFGVMIAVYFYLLRTPYAGRFVCAIFCLTAVVLFIYYYPVWTGMPIEREGYYARMWLQGPGLRDWI